MNEQEINDFATDELRENGTFWLTIKGPPGFADMSIHLEGYFNDTYTGAPLDRPAIEVAVLHKHNPDLRYDTARCIEFQNLETP